MQISALLSIVPVALSIVVTPADIVVIDVMKEYGEINESTTWAATDRAKQVIGGGQSAKVLFPAGDFLIGKPSTGYMFDLSDVKPYVGQRLIISGAGMDATTLRSDGGFDTINGLHVYQVTFQDLTFARLKQSTTQGVVVTASTTSITVDIQDGYPTPADIIGTPSRLKPGGGRWLRKFRQAFDGSCQLVADEHPVWPYIQNSQVKWTNISLDPSGKDGRRWIFTGLRWDYGNVTQPIYSPGDLIGVKSKHNGQAFFMDGGNDVKFLNIKWTEHSRGVIRGGLSNIHLENTRIEKSPMAPNTKPGPCMATPGGGPQLGQPDDPQIQNVTVVNHTAFGTGDDSVAFFNVGSGSVSGCHISDSFARGILLDASPRVKAFTNTLIRCPLLNVSGL